MTPRLSLVFPLAALVVALLLYLLTPPPPSQTAAAALQFRFTWVYGEVLVDELLALLVVTLWFFPLVSKHLGTFLSHKIQLAGPARVLAIVVTVVGFLIFAFWAMTDCLGGYNGPGYAISNYPYVAAIYNGLGFDRLGFWDQQGIIGFLSFCVSVLSLMFLRAGRGVGTAIREGVTFFAAPVLLVFEFALSNYAPLDMYWHATTFTSWSLGSFLTVAEFQAMMNSGYYFVWEGNVYLLSNWFVLLASFALLMLGISKWRRPSEKALRRAARRGSHWWG